MPSINRLSIAAVYVGLVFGAATEVKDQILPSSDLVGTVTVCEKCDLISFPGPSNDNNQCLTYTGYDSDANGVLDEIRISDGRTLYQEDNHPDFDDISARLE